VLLESFVDFLFGGLAVIVGVNLLHDWLDKLLPVSLEGISGVFGDPLNGIEELLWLDESIIVLVDHLEDPNTKFLW